MKVEEKLVGTGVYDSNQYPLLSLEAKLQTIKQQNGFPGVFPFACRRLLGGRKKRTEIVEHWVRNP